MRVPTTRPIRCLAICLVVVLLAPAVAAADGDPASDYLLAQNVYYPVTPPVSGSLQRALNAETAAAARAGFPIKIALIDSRNDLGAVGELFGRPQTYATFLEHEIDFDKVQPLLIVMPSGYGESGLPSASMTAAEHLRRPAGTTSDDLATAALAAVAKLAAADGRSVKPGPRRAQPTASASGPAAFAWPAAAAVLLAGAILYARRRHAFHGARRPGARG